MTKRTVVFVVLLIMSLTGTVFLYRKVGELEKENRFIRAQQGELEEQLSAARLKISELEGVHKARQGEGALPVSHFPMGEGVSGALETRIQGTFDGWEGETVFTMQDGSRWQQDEYSVAYHFARNPRVVLYYRNGSTYMQVEGMNEEVRVKRLK